MNVWRLHLRTKGADLEKVPPEERVKFCIERGVLGVGWRVDTDKPSLTWDEYFLKSGQIYRDERKDKGWRPAINAIKNKMREGDLCWMRNLDGVYYLGRVTSDWRYEPHGDFGRADVVNVRDCEWKKVGLADAVPGAVVNSFIARMTLRKVLDKHGTNTVTEISKYIYNKWSERQVYTIQLAQPDLFALLSAGACEDMVALYLGLQEWICVPSTAKRDTQKYEFLLINSADGRRAVVQVKNGSESLSINDYEDYIKNKEADEVFLFTSHGKYVGTPAPNVHCLAGEDLLKFAYSNRARMTRSIQDCMDLLEEVKNGSA
jgi:hypothetical protein